MEKLIQKLRSVFSNRALEKSTLVATMALEKCLGVTTVRTATPHLSPCFPTSREKLVFPTHTAFKKSMSNTKLSYQSLYSTYRKSRFVCNAREAVNEGKWLSQMQAFSLSIYWIVLSNLLFTCFSILIRIRNFSMCLIR